MNQKRLAERFSVGATKGRAGNVFIEDDCIYSYGYHFVIAKRFLVRKGGGAYYRFLLNTNKYSSSTSRQQSRVRYAVCGFPTEGVANLSHADKWPRKRTPRPQKTEREKALAQAVAEVVDAQWGALTS